MTNAEKLEEAETALHDLVTGKAATVSADQNGERVEYARTSLDRLRGYTAHLRKLVGKAAPPRTIVTTSSKGLI